MSISVYDCPVCHRRFKGETPICVSCGKPATVINSHWYQMYPAKPIPLWRRRSWAMKQVQEARETEAKK